MRAISFFAVVITIPSLLFSQVGQGFSLANNSSGSLVPPDKKGPSLVMRSSVQNSAGERMESANFRLLSCVGQSTPIGKLSNTNSEIGAGFIYTTKISPIPGITEPKPSLPKVFALSQNFPNPFIGRTTIRYTLPVKSKVTLTIYDLLGRRVETLVDKEESPGYKSVVWDGDRHTAGIYFYRLKAGNFLAVEKTLIVK